jgi:phosphate uptake regulator
LNNEEGNMRAAFDKELTELQAQLVELGEMVQTQLDDALATGDADAIQGIVRHLAGPLPADGGRARQ